MNFVHLLIGAFALAALAANSLFARLSLGDGHIDEAGYTIVRLGSGALVLALILYSTKSNRSSKAKGRWDSALMLFLYAIFFSIAYLKLTTASGALILFGAVQCTMIGISIIKGNRLTTYEWFGISIAFGGLMYLLLPGINAPPIGASLLMLLAGIAWGIYTLNGKSSTDAIADTAYNFIRTVPMLALTALIFFNSLEANSLGIMYAIASGAITSGLGYVLWYKTLSHISPTQAAVLQLSVPVIAAFMGVIFVGELITQRLVIASLLILGGIFIVIQTQSKLSIN